MKEIKLLVLKNIHILKQLQIEEALLRTAKSNYCIINRGSKDAIVMGISSDPHKLIDLKKTRKTPIIKRFSGGGTVYVDKNTLFISFIGNKPLINTSLFPEPIFRWTENFYKPIFGKEFSLRENDYVFGEKKFGGNAQYIKKDRWLHHSSFLWDYSKEKMNLLLLPEKRPQYRRMRDHNDFLTKLKEKIDSQESLIEKSIYQLKQMFSVEEILLEEVEEILKRPHRKATTVINPLLLKQP